MTRLLPTAFSSAAIVAAMACAGDTVVPPAAPADAPMFDRFAKSEWSEPVHLDAPVNSPARELGPELSPDGLSLYFGSDRTGSIGDIDIWASRRECLDCAWGTPVNLGPNINSAQSDGGPTFSPDGHMMFFSSNREPGTLGGDDLWVSWREDTNDDLGWTPAVNLGPNVNTADHEGGPTYTPALHAEGASLYFARGSVIGSGADIFRVLVDRHGEALEAAIPVTALNTPESDAETSIRGDGKEIVFHSARLGGVGPAGVRQFDLWISTRQNVNDDWPTPRNMGAVINTTGGELTPFLSRDGRTLLWSATMTARPSLGRQDIWMSTRTPSGQ